VALVVCGFNDDGVTLVVSMRIGGQRRDARGRRVLHGGGPYTHTHVSRTRCVCIHTLVRWLCVLILLGS